MLGYGVDSFAPIITPILARKRFNTCMQLAPAHTKDIREAARLALGLGENLKGLEIAHELSTNELSMRPWKTFFDTLVANKVTCLPVLRAAVCEHASITSNHCFAMSSTKISFCSSFRLYP